MIELHVILLSDADLEELALQNDMEERGRRLRAFAKATENKEWFRAQNGECVLVPKGLTGRARSYASRQQGKNRRYRDKQIERLMRAVKSA